MAPPLELAGGEVHVWTARLNEGLPADRGLLSDEEKARAERLRVPARRDRWTQARARLRAILALYLDLAPREIGLTVGPHGKPELERVGDAPALRFNLSHAGELALYGVARELEVGVDVERVRDDLDLVRLARRMLGPAVVEELERTAPAERAVGFARAWARNEARLKCLGTGLDADGAVGEEPVTVLDLPAPPGYAAAVALQGELALRLLPTRDAPALEEPPGCELSVLAPAGR